jgi:hypothetical protein
MPIKSCQSDKIPGFKWGDAGKCYTYNPKNEGSKRNARKKATAQGIAIGEIKLEGLRVSFDYHDTLTTDEGKRLLEKELKDNNLIYIISAAHDINELLPFAEKHGIRKDRVFATGSNYNKVDKIKELDIVRHYDNSSQVDEISSKTDGLKAKIINITKEKFAKIGERGGISESRKAPKSDTPNRNPQGEGTAKGSASSQRGAEVSKEVEEILRKKADEFNERYKEKLGYGVNIGMLKSVYQRGIGAYNVSHSPEVKSSGQWAQARVNAFLYLVKEGRPQNSKYTGDFDLLPKGHPKNT